MNQSKLKQASVRVLIPLVSASNVYLNNTKKKIVIYLSVWKQNGLKYVMCVKNYK